MSSHSISFIADDIDQIVISILHRLRTVDLDLSLRSKLCGNRDKDPDTRGLRVKDDTIRLQFELRNDIARSGHTIACDVLYRQVLTALRRCRLGPKHSVWVPVCTQLLCSPAAIEGSASMAHHPRWSLTAPQQQCLLLQRLPPELRSLIYTFTLITNVEEDAKATTLARLEKDLASVVRLEVVNAVARMQHLPQRQFAPPALAAVCSQILEEILPVLRFLLEKRHWTAISAEEEEAVDEWLSQPAHRVFKVRRDELVSRIQ